MITLSVKDGKWWAWARLESNDKQLLWYLEVTPTQVKSLSVLYNP